MSKKSKHLDKDVIPRGNPEHYVLHHFFISYSSVNSDDALVLCNFLQATGLRAFVDRDTRDWDAANPRKDDPRGKPIPGTDHDIGKTLSVDLRASETLLVIATDASYESEWVAREFEFFFTEERPIIVWHPDGDFWKRREHRAESHPLSRELFRAMTGDDEVPWVLQHIPEERTPLISVVRRVLFWHDLIEFASWHGSPHNCDGVEQHRLERMKVLADIIKCREAIYTEYGRTVVFFRQPHPYADAAPRRRKGRHKPFRIRELESMRRVLDDQQFREEIFATLPPPEDTEKYLSNWDVLSKIV